jgi:2,3-bisphosphoglycerate-independent phosphoglycerate mutase
MILPDHPTPVDLRTHTSDPVPYIIFDSRNIRNNKIAFSEFFDFEQKNFFNNGYELIDVFLNKNKIN